ncbi:Uncharacterized protein Cob_v010164 [Colletotrichum orbiculare MAFF 240422]|uniref:T6SS Phospholipase effector Tle1-like catalytic domain-containing protein n=1 Tax=Colletotrichum orbiculare (strain 104-T / ATCC 96160 / CBS 514.97 / LARS 414 / MAFF 240422) TaxID=1213857 RepID=A0A484FGA6_COLOR|nr:Uncharacterized protein Cob_v010164 [Colletotrichum orbiculare MAFF 240422]
MPWLRIDALMLLIVWYIPVWRPSAHEASQAWLVAAAFLPNSFGWAAGDVSLAAYIHAALARQESDDKNTSALGAVMAFLYSFYITLYAVAGTFLGRYLDSVYTASGGSDGGGTIHSGLINTAGVQFTVVSVVVFCATFVPRGAFSPNPEMISEERLDKDMALEDMEKHDSPSSENRPWDNEITIEVPQLGPQLGPCAHRTSKYANKKRLVICCDGTWNNSNKKGIISTNVARLSAAVAHKCCTGMPQVVFYHRGAGTDESKVAQVLGGVLGKGIIGDIADVYRFICDNYNPGDELVIIGFSRGAFTARSVAGMVCNIGLLNRVGLASFGDIFHDYQNFPNWRPGTGFDKGDHLVGFTLTNYERLERFRTKDAARADARDHDEMEGELDEDKKKFFESMTKCTKKNGKPDLMLMAKKYRHFLEKHYMILCERKLEERDGVTDFFFSPVDVTIQAVGNLGWPKMPWEKLRTDRSADELRFASLDVHPNVEHAFHALALDEWRTAFSPTLWGKRGNDSTHLRQVWFPGSHSNVGGGFEDQQIATIALAWMADQLTSVGVEFSTPEMKRIFYTIDPGVEARDWGKGRISNPSAATALPDKAYNAVWYPWQKLRGQDTVAGTRTPGSYREDGKQDFIQNPNELIHPSVRVRYLYEGLGLDDVGDWHCPALTSKGFTLQKSTAPFEAEEPAHQHFIASEYETLSGKVASVHQGLPIDPSTEHKLVVHQLPYESHLYQLDRARNNWVWTDGEKTLREERIGMWERLYIMVNHDLLDKQEQRKLAREQRERLQGEDKKKQGLGGMVRSWVTGNVGAARATAGDVLSKTVGKLVAGAGKPKPLDYPAKFGYHDFVSWQRGDMTTPAKRGKA